MPAPDVICLSVPNPFFEGRNQVYLTALEQIDGLYETIASIVKQHHANHGVDPTAALRILKLDQALCPRMGMEHELRRDFDFDAAHAHRALAAMELPATTARAPSTMTLTIKHPGGVGDILHDADGGSWLQGIIIAPEENTGPINPDSSSDLQFVAIA